MEVSVEVEYCSIGGYEPRFQELEQQVLQAIPHASVRGAVGRKSSFEISVNDVEVFSKLKVGRFPSHQEVLDVVKAVSNGEEVPTTETGTEGMCVIL